MASKAGENGERGLECLSNPRLILSAQVINYDSCVEKGVDSRRKVVYNVNTKNERKEMPMPKVATKRINVTFPVRLLEDLDRYAPPRKRNQIIVAATESYVRKLKLLAVLKETAGAWDEESHPELATPEDIDRWLRQIRSTWRREPLWQEERSA